MVKQVTDTKISKIKLFCFPYAGASAVVYAGWKKHFAPSVELIPIELRGRGRRARESHYTDFAEMQEDVYQIVSSQVTDGNFALFGHSMGAIVAHHVAALLKKRRFLTPIRVFLSGRKAPHWTIQEAYDYHLMDDETLKNKLRELGGTPPAFFEHQELMDIFLDVIRSDFSIVDSYNQQEAPILDSDLSILIGKEEGYEPLTYCEWDRYTTASCEVRLFDGDHFFLHDQQQAVLEAVSSSLKTDTIKMV